METTDIAAYLGALAWLPQLFRWGYSYITKPVIRIIPDRTAQIGHTIFGPIFNLRLSIDVNRKDTIVDFIGVQLRHKDGGTYDFEWMGMNEIFSEVISPGVKSPETNQIVQKDVFPIAIKISSLSLVERFFRFQERGFISENRIKRDDLLKANNLAKKMKQQGKNVDSFWIDMEKYLTFLREQFIWKAGKYTIKFIIRSPAKFDSVQENAEFELTQEDIDTLNLNFSVMDLIKKNVENELENNGQQLEEINWVWINPEIQK